jgi:hypothetical protein
MVLLAFALTDPTRTREVIAPEELIEHAVRSPDENVIPTTVSDGNGIPEIVPRNR